MLVESPCAFDCLTACHTGKQPTSKEASKAAAADKQQIALAAAKQGGRDPQEVEQQLETIVASANQQHGQILRSQIKEDYEITKSMVRDRVWMDHASCGSKEPCTPSCMRAAPLKLHCKCPRVNGRRPRSSTKQFGSGHMANCHHGVIALVRQQVKGRTGV